MFNRKAIIVLRAYLYQTGSPANAKPCPKIFPKTQTGRPDPDGERIGP